MKPLLLSPLLALCLLLLITQQAHARPDGQQQFEHTTASDIQKKKKKKIDRRKQGEQYEYATADAIRTINKETSSTTSISSIASSNNDKDFQLKFHQRQIEKQIRLDELHAQVSETLTAHHTGQRKLSDAELESHTKKQLALDRKRTSLREETPERYMERMKRMEEKLIKKVERKERRREERFQRMMDSAGEEL